MAAAEAPLTGEALLTDAISRNPKEMMLELDRLEANDSLSNFAALMWHVCEPSRPLIRGWAWDCLCEHLEYIHYGYLRRLLINVPPGFSKSFLMNVFLPAWEWGPRNRPDLRQIGFSYNAELTLRDNKRCRAILQSDLYRALWGDRVHLVTRGNKRYDNNHSGWKLATSVNGTGMGERGDRISIDDPNNVKTVESDVIREDTNFWFAEVIPTRINDPDLSSITVIQQRTHSRDVSGLIMREQLNYEHLCLPMEFEVTRRCFTSVQWEGQEAEKVRKIKCEDEPLERWIDADEEVPKSVERVGPVVELFSQDWRTEEGELLAPERFSQRHLDEDLKPALRAFGGTYAESAQLQQRPSPRGGGMFQQKDFQLLDLGDPLWPKFPNWARGYDLAGTEDNTSPWSAGVKVAVVGQNVFIADVQRVRFTPGKVVTWMQGIAERDGYQVEIDFPQDPGQAGKAQKGFLSGEFHGYVIRSSPESGSKEARALPLAAQSENGNLYLLRAPWNDIFIAEACMFPRGDFKDMIDAASRAYARAVKLALTVQDVPSAPKVIGG